MNIDKFKTLENKLSAAYKNNNLLFIANINTADDFDLLTNLQKEDMLILAENYQYDIYRKISIGIISPKDMSFNSCALKCGAAYTYYLRRYLLPLYQEKPLHAKQLASEIFDHIAANPYLPHKGKWNEYFLIILGG